MEKDKGSSSPFGSFLQYFYGNFIVLLLGFVSIPLITRVMSNEQYGRTGMFTSAVTVLYIFAIFGMDQAYIRFYYVGGVDRKKLMARCLFPALGIVILLCLVYGIFADRANDFLFGERGWDLTCLVISYTIFSVFERFLFLDIRMSQNGRLYSNLNILSKVVYIILIIVFARLLGDNFRVVLLAMTISLGIITAIIGVRYLIINNGAERKNNSDETLEAIDNTATNNTGETIGKEETDDKITNAIETDKYGANGVREPDQRDIITYGIPFILVLLMEWLLSSCDKWSLRIWSDYGELGIYNSAMNIMSILLTFKATFVAFWSPVAMQRYEEEDDNVIFFKSAFNITRFFCILAGLGMILLRTVIVLILGPKYQTAVNVIPFLTLMPVFSILFEITNQGIKFKKKNRYLNYASALAIVFNVVGNAMLVPVLGGVGAALATGITYVAYFFVGSFFSEKCYRVGYGMLRTVLYGLLLIIYAFIAVFVGEGPVCALTGIAFIILLLILEKGTLMVCINYFRRLISR